VKGMNCTDLLKVIWKQYPSVPNTHGTKVTLGFAMKNLGFDSKDHSNVPYYKAVPLKVA